MGITFSVEQYVTIVYDCRNGKLSQEQALKDINKKYKSTQKYIKREIINIMNKHRFYRFVSGGIDELISIYDKSMDRSFEKDRKNYLNIYEKIINEYLLADELEGTQKLDADMAKVAINDERSKVEKLCRIEKSITEYYEKAVDDIANIQKTSEKSQEPELIPNEKMPSRFQKMLADKVITGEKINRRWVVNNEKHGIKELMEWAEEYNEVFSTSYIMQTFCKRDGNPFTRGSINTYRSKYGLTGSDE
jgi:hypothetical protein